MQEERTRQYESGYSIKVFYIDTDAIEGPHSNPVVERAEVYQGNILKGRYFGSGANRKCKKLIRYLTSDNPSWRYYQYLMWNQPIRSGETP